MVRVKRGNVAAKRRKKYLNLAKGFVGFSIAFKYISCRTSCSKS